ncbi:MAG: hypothetical protein IPP31_04355 [Chitinophagaceae bacterium]|nr:hypothetical protein [Chitinophagaceae bacterium]
MLVTTMALVSTRLSAQLTLSGVVYDSSRINLVEGVRVVSTGGLFTVTDSMGRYAITVNEKDSVTFLYRNKPTQKFAVSTIPDPSKFNISLHVTVKGKYSTLKEVIVYSRSYRQDSLENRQTYADVFDFQNPTVRTSTSPDGMVGADVNELINMFRFKRNKRLRAFRLRLEGQEQDRYVNYRFNKTTVKRITGLEGEALDTFMLRYRPDYEFVSNADELQLNQYILNASYRYKMELLKK